MSDWSELKRLAEAAVDDFGSFDPSESEQEFMGNITPQNVLELLAENAEQAREIERLQKDALRYRFLREKSIDAGMWDDLSVDAAMSREKGNG